MSSGARCIAGDARAVAATYREDATELGPCGPPLTGRAAIEEHYRRMFENVKFTLFTFSHLDATVNGNIGYDAGTYEETAGPAGTPGMTLTGQISRPAQARPGRMESRVRHLQLRRTAAALRTVIRDGCR